jgi:hypothetical protein
MGTSARDSLGPMTKVPPPTPAPRTDLVPGRIEAAIVVVRGQKVLLDETLAALYDVEVRALNQAVKRNLERFPADFVFQLTAEEAEALRSQTVILETSPGHHRKYLPHAFTEQGVAMLSSVLHSPRAVQVNVEIMRTFVRLRRWLSSHAELARKLSALERRYDVQFKVIFDAIRKIMKPAPAPRRRIGFKGGQG